MGLEVPFAPYLLVFLFVSVFFFLLVLRLYQLLRSRFRPIKRTKYVAKKPASHQYGQDPYSTSGSIRVR